jgi:protein-tyrosine phosphatase
MYEMIFFEESSKEVYRKFFADLISVNPDDGAVLWHCTQGKDRAGCATAMLLAALGADRSLIMADYNLSKEYYSPMVMRIPVQTETQKAVISTLIGANPVIFEAALDKIDAQYGSFCNYLKECIGVTEPMMQTLRDRFLK